MTSKFRVLLLICDDRYYSIRTFRKLLEKNREELCAVGVVVAGVIPTRKWRDLPKHLLALTMLYGLTGISEMIRARLSGMSLAGVATSEGVPVLEISDVNSDETIAALRQFQPDIIIHQSPQRVGDVLRSLPGMSMINRHVGSLPNYRGLYAPFWAWYEKDPTPGVSILKVGAGWDNGELVWEAKLSESQSSRHAVPAPLLRELMDLSDAAMADLIVRWREKPPEFSAQRGTSRTRTVPSWSVLMHAGWRILRGSWRRVE